jgi:dTDP-4-amino-4,6-dideoxygalactose transaminase
MFEEEIAEYTGAPYAVALDNCTDALFLCCTYLNVENVTIPKKTYLSVPQAVMASGGKLSFDDVEWNHIRFMIRQEDSLQICTYQTHSCVYRFIPRRY